MSVDEQIDEIVLKPAQWQYDDYLEAKAKLQKIIREARIDELEKYQAEWYMNAEGELDPRPNVFEDWLGADLYDRISALKKGEG